jgi:hypothetical protein
MELKRIELRPYKWWTGENGKVPNAKGQPKRQKIFETIQSQPGLSTAQIAQLTHLSPCCVNYHLDCMARTQQISCYISPLANRRYYFSATYRSKKLKWPSKAFNFPALDKKIESSDRTLAQKVAELELTTTAEPLKLLLANSLMSKLCCILPILS